MMPARAFSVYSIPTGLSFVDVLAHELWTAAQGDPLRLAAGTVYLPTRRGCRMLQAAFLRLFEGRAALLPRLLPLGDVEEDDLLTAEDDSADLPPSMDPLRRRLLMTRLVRKKDASLPLDQAVGLADALARFIDTVQTAQLSFDALAHIVPEDLAQHWQDTLAFLEIVTKEWPALLAEEGCLDPIDRHNRLMFARAAAWEKAPPADPVVVAGATGGTPATSALMRAAAALPQGCVVLPGLDLALDSAAWDAIDESHPQFAMKTWLDALPLTRAAVGVWGKTAEAPRVRLLQEALRPAAVTDAWRALEDRGFTPHDCKGLARVEADSVQEESAVIALVLRAALEEAGKTAALVTPDRGLAARVVAALARYGIEADDSAGAALGSLPLGQYLLALLDAATPDPSPVAMLALLKHPFAACGIAKAQCRARARAVEKNVWRGVRLTRGFSGAAVALRRDGDEMRTALAAWLDTVAAAFAAFGEAPRALKAWVSDHAALAEKLATTDIKAGADLLWQGAAGEAAAHFLADLARADKDFGALTLADYRRLLAALLRGVAVRPLYGLHPRLSILGPLEARLWQPDLFVLGGMNKGTWPRQSPPDPWLSRPMKQAFGLPLPERIEGLSAHDFVQLAAAPQVLMTRARRAEGADIVPSRFWLQLDAVLQVAFGTSEKDPLTPATDWLSLVRARDVPGTVTPMPRPRPVPNVAARPRALSVTQIGTWMRHPYAIYARHILGLRALERLDQDPSRADYGSCLHKALELFMRAPWPADPLAALCALGQKVIADLTDRPEVLAYWLPQFNAAAAFVIETESARRATGVQALAQECEGSYMFEALRFTLHGRADRIDRLPDGSVEIVDYKTGTVPSVKAEVLRGIEPQLPLLGLLAQQGGFSKLSSSPVGALSYWSLKGRGKDDIVSIPGPHADLIAKAEEGLRALIAHYDDPATPYDPVPRASAAPKYDDYADLARLAEWGRA